MDKESIVKNYLREYITARIAEKFLVANFAKLYVDFKYTDRIREILNDTRYEYKFFEELKNNKEAMSKYLRWTFYGAYAFDNFVNHHVNSGVELLRSTDCKLPFIESEELEEAVGERLATYSSLWELCKNSQTIRQLNVRHYYMPIFFDNLATLYEINLYGKRDELLSATPGNELECEEFDFTVTDDDLKNAIFRGLAARLYAEI